MPELPEVETVARLVRPDLVGRGIVGTRVSWERSLGGTSRRAFSGAVRGTRIVAVTRRGKHVLVGLERAGRDAGALVIHLRMTGRLHVVDADERPGPYVRVGCRLDDGHRLDFVDVRKFGRFVHHPDPAALLADLGPEPLGPDFTREWLHAALCGRRRRLKPLLLDQRFLAGLGNIYVDEALHTARLHPLTSSHCVSRRKATALHGAIRATLTEAIAREGSSFDTFYRTPEGHPGSYQHQFRVYGRQGKPCRTCGAAITRIVVGQRGTHICRRCQRG